MTSAGHVAMEIVFDASPGWNVILPFWLIKSGLRLNPSGVLHELLLNARLYGGGAGLVLYLNVTAALIDRLRVIVNSTGLPSSAAL
jgi:hypothetical protein